jgi:hypothetical protein
MDTFCVGQSSSKFDNIFHLNMQKHRAVFKIDLVVASRG